VEMFNLTGMGRERKQEAPKHGQSTL
jgi:hypothetical protein